MLVAPVRSPVKHEQDGALRLLPPAPTPARDSRFLAALGKGQEGMDLVRSRSSTITTHREASPAMVPDTLASGGSLAVPTGLPLGRTSAEREGTQLVNTMASHVAQVLLLCWGQERTLASTAHTHTVAARPWVRGPAQPIWNSMKLLFAVLPCQLLQTTVQRELTGSARATARTQAQTVMCS